MRAVHKQDVAEKWTANSLDFSLCRGSDGICCLAGTADVVRESHAKGPFARTLLGVVAIHDVWGLIAFSLCLSVSTALVGVSDGAQPPLVAVYEIEGAVLPGTLLGFPSAWLSGHDLQSQLVSNGHSLPTIVMTGYGPIAMCVQAMQADAITFLEKPFATDDLVAAVRRALADDAERRREHQARAAFERKMNLLTDEERRVLDFPALGRTSSNIASEMGLTLRTTQFRRAAIWKKLEVSSRDELMEFLLKENQPQLKAD